MTRGSGWRIGAAALAFAAAARGGIVLDALTVSGDEIVRRHRLHVSGARLLLESAGNRDAPFRPALGFDADRDEISVFDHEARRVLVLDAAVIDRMAAQMRGMMALLPPPARPPRGAAGAATRAVPLDETREISGRTAAGHRILLDETPVFEIWIVPAAAAGASPAEARTAAMFFDRLVRLDGALPGTADAAGLPGIRGFARLEGFPALVRSLGEREETTRIDIAPRDIGEALFRVPAGYAKVALPDVLLGLPPDGEPDAIEIPDPRDPDPQPRRDP